MIEVSGLIYTVGNCSLLDNINFEAKSSEILAVIGPNGAGKSTLLKLISKQLKPKIGSIHINGTDLKTIDLKTLSKYRAVLPQSHFLNINLTVFDIAVMGRYPHFKSYPEPIDIEITHQALAEMGMLKFKDRLIHNLSGGEQQRVQLARVLAQIYDNPDAILLMDEPITGLDLQYQQIILEKAKSLSSTGVTVFCILHDINLAAQYADNVLILKQGQTMGFGSPQEILSEELIFNTYHTRVRRLQDQNLGYPVIMPVS